MSFLTAGTMVADVFDNYLEHDKDLLLKRSYTLKNGNKVNISKTDPYGFWEVHMEKGQLPDKLKGQYTTPMEAEKAVTSYFNDDWRREIVAVAK
jgi:hypothetical protein